MTPPAGVGENIAAINYCGGMEAHRALDAVGSGSEATGQSCHTKQRRAARGLGRHVTAVSGGKLIQPIQILHVEVGGKIGSDFLKGEQLNYVVLNSNI